MTILEYAKKLNLNLNAYQIEILNRYQEGKENLFSTIMMTPRMNGRQMIYDLITRYEGYMQGRQDAIQEFREKINNYLNESTDFADFVVTDTAIDYVLDEMKGGAENE